MKRNDRKAHGLRRWVQNHYPLWEYFLFDVPWSRRSVAWIVALLILLAIVSCLPVEVMAKWFEDAVLNH